MTPSRRFVHPLPLDPTAGSSRTVGLPVQALDNRFPVKTREAFGPLSCMRDISASHGLLPDFACLLEAGQGVIEALLDHVPRS